MSVFQHLGTRIRQFFLCSLSSLRCVEVQGVKMIDFFEQQEFLKRAARTCRLLVSFECASLSALVKRTATITQAGLGSQTKRSETAAFKILLCVIEVAYIFDPLKAITVIFFCLGEDNTQRTSTLSKVTTEFAHNGTSWVLHKEHYCRIDIISELKCI